MATYEQILEANRATFAAWNAHDPEAVAAIFATDATIRDVGSPEILRGRDAIRDRAAVNFWDVTALMTQLGVGA